MFDSCRNALASRKVIVDLLVIFFGIGAWIGINGMYVQLPLMVQTQPEGWNLPSYLSIVVQIGNIGPISYTLLQKFWPDRVRDSWLIYGILTVGCTSLLLMSFFYKEVTFFGETEHSTALLSLVFFVALVGCTSSVLFMPFLRHFKGTYLISYFVGEGLSGFVPSIVALIQGVGGNPICINETVNGSNIWTSYTPPPRFSTESFFIFLFCTLVLSNLSFVMLNNLKYLKSEKVYSSTNLAYKQSSDSTNTPVPVSTIQGFTMDDERLKTSPNDDNSSYGKAGSQDDTLKPKDLSRKVYIYYLVLVSWLCFFSNGLFPGIQSYSCLPYGNVAYHLAVTLGSMANPAACFLAFFMPYSSVTATTVMGVLGTALSAFIAATALLSPTPPLVGTTGGEALIVLVWILYTGLISYIKVSVASVFRQEDGRKLFWCGAMQQLGSALGAILGFFLINFANIFHSYIPCQ
ncbi:solute carrier family 52, riboflavin transporter, member 3-B isoform X2 [Bacillus rossius redtenbacheri]